MVCLEHVCYSVFKLCVRDGKQIHSRKQGGKTSECLLPVWGDINHRVWRKPTVGTHMSPDIPLQIVVFQPPTTSNIFYVGQTIRI
jgi:hypothetical protein